MAADALSVNGIPGIWQNRTFESFQTKFYSQANRAEAEKILRVARNYVLNFEAVLREHKGIGLYFWATAKGNGKTLLSTAVGNALASKGVHVQWFSMPILLNEIKQTFDDKSGNTANDVIGKAQNAGFLILDDLNTERASSWVNEVVYSIIDDRLRKGKPILYTSNCEQSKLTFDSRIIDRIVSGSLPLHFPEESIRVALSSVGKQRLLKQLES